MGVVASVYGKGVFVYLYSIYKKKAAAQDKEGLFTFLAENNITLWKEKMTSRIKRKKRGTRWCMKTTSNTKILATNLRNKIAKPHHRLKLN